MACRPEQASRENRRQRLLLGESDRPRRVRPDDPHVAEAVAGSSAGRRRMRSSAQARFHAVEGRTRRPLDARAARKQEPKRWRVAAGIGAGGERTGDNRDSITSITSIDPVASAAVAGGCREGEVTDVHAWCTSRVVASSTSEDQPVPAFRALRTTDIGASLRSHRAMEAL